MKLQGITLYRGLTPGALGMDVHGGYGETWTHDFDDAKGYARPPQGYVLEAVLPLTAKRLVLVTVDAEGYSDYIEDGIRLLAEIVQDPWLYDSLMFSRVAMWDQWEPEWTELLIQAGYDSIFTSGFDGPEEYVLKANLLQFTYCYRILPDGEIEAYPVEPGMLEQLECVVG